MSIPSKEMLIDRAALIKAFQDTRRIMKENDQLRAQTERMLAGTRLYFPGFQAMYPSVKGDGPEITIVKDTSFHCAQTQVGQGDRVAVLNFANAYHPGGGVVNGAMAQEECLCRSSNLYAALTLPYLLRNYYKWNAKNTGDIGTDSVIYSPGVTVFKTDDPVPELMEKDNWFQVDVLTCAAPYYDKDRKHPLSIDKLRSAFCDRIDNILAVAAANNVDILVLGAFGCGAFNNPPEVVADVFYDQLTRGRYVRCFRKVLFAIKADGVKGMKNYNTFSECFGGENGAV